MERIKSFGELKSMTYDEPNLTIKYTDIFGTELETTFSLAHPVQVPLMIKKLGGNVTFCEEFKNKVKVKNKALFAGVMVILKSGKGFDKNAQLYKILSEKLGTLEDLSKGQLSEKPLQYKRLDVLSKEEEQQKYGKVVKSLKQSLDDFLKIDYEKDIRFVQKCIIGFGDIYNVLKNNNGILHKHEIQYPKTCGVILCKDIGDFLNEANKIKMFSSKKEFSIDEKILDFFKIKEVAKLMKGKIGIFYNVIWTNEHAKKLKQACEVARELSSKQSKNSSPANYNLAPNKPSIEFKELDFKCISEFLNQYDSSVLPMAKKYYNVLTDLTKGKRQVDNKAYNYINSLSKLITSLTTINNIKQKKLLDGIDEFIKGL